MTHALPPRVKSITMTPFRTWLHAVGVILLLVGATALAFGIAMLLNPKLMGGAAASAWSAMCGQPAGRPSTSLLLIDIGAATALVGAIATTVTAATRVRRFVALIASLVVTLAGAGVGYATGLVTLAAGAPPPAGKFAVLNPPRPMPNFILRNTHGGMTELRDLTDGASQPSVSEGKATLIFFGYTHCPDLCPTTLSDYRRVKRALGADAERVNFVFISVDGERDTPDYLANYISAFDPAFIALVAHPSVVRSILRDYGGDFRTEPTPGTENYKVLHTADSYLLDGQGRWRVLLPIGTPVEDVVREIRQTLT